MKKKTNTTKLSRLLWVLYSDANSRFNTLIEECAHLQDTIISLVGDPTGIRRIINEQAAENPEFLVGFKRSVACNPRASTGHDRCSMRDQAFLNLWNMLGGLITGLIENQERHHNEYVVAAKDLLTAKTANGPMPEGLYWYISTRGYFLSRVFRLYTAQLEHAHEKMIQMLENQAGSLPNPILLRRWNSGAYGEFLSEYSRHVNWEANTLIRLLTGLPFEDSPNVMNPELRHDVLTQSITHTWAHYPTSLVNQFDVKLSVNADRKHWERDKSEAAKPRKQRFASIRSAYFYLEQPILFPLLYHECVHINFPDADGERAIEGSFFDARHAAIQSLRLAKFPVDPGWTYENFWDHFSEEVWADAASIVLSGRAYFVSLALQISGLSGQNEFNHFDIAEDITQPLNDLGRREHRKYEIPAPRLEMAYFWEARLSIAIRVLEVVQKRRPEPTVTQDMVDAAKDLLDSWRLSGRSAFEERGTSEKHSKYWVYRESINDWVADTVWRYLQDPIEKASECAPLCVNYDLAHSNVRRNLERAVNGYRAKYILPSFSERDAHSFSPNNRLDEIACDLRWRVAGDVIHRMQIDHGSINAWTRSFANWMRNDGSGSVRLAIEAQRLRYSLLDTAADIADSASAGAPLPKALPPIVGRLASISKQFYLDDAVARQRLLRSRRILDEPSRTNRNSICVELLKEIDRIVNMIMAGVGFDSSVHASSKSEELQIGTLSLGVIRPDEFVASQDLGGFSLLTTVRSPYWAAMTMARAAFDASVQMRRDVTNESREQNERPKFESAFFPLVGEYQFLTFTHGATPVERDAHPAAPTVRTLLKPRLVILAGGEPIQAYSTNIRHMWGRISLIKFQYKWQWYDIKQRLDEMLTSSSPRVASKYSIYLSSAWEDAVLLTWHDSPTGFWELGNIGIGMSDTAGIDIQSAYFVPEAHYQTIKSDEHTRESQTRSSESVTPPVTASSPIDGSWAKAMANWASESGLVAIMNDRSGRFDYTVIWGGESAIAASGLEGDEQEAARSYAACAKGLASIPDQLWTRVATMSTSFEKNIITAPGGWQQKYVAITHFALKDRIIASR